MLNELLGGTIIDSGSNANGDYIKFSNGTLICTKKKVFSGVSCNTAYGSLYETGDLDLGDYAHPFVGNNPIVFVNKIANYGCICYGVSSATLTSFGTTNLMTPRSWNTASFGLGLLAIGRWK